MNKYKVGDSVVVLDRLSERNGYSYVSPMDKYSGQIATITKSWCDKIRTSYHTMYELDLKGQSMYWDECLLGDIFNSEEFETEYDALFGGTT